MQLEAMLTLPSLEARFIDVLAYENHHDFKMPKASRNPCLSRMDERTSLYGNQNSAVLHEEIEKIININYHHHGNFNTNPSPSGQTGFGGYMETSTPAWRSIKTMNEPTFYKPFSDKSARTKGFNPFSDR